MWQDTVTLGVGLAAIAAPGRTVCHAIRTVPGVRGAGTADIRRVHEPNLDSTGDEELEKAQRAGSCTMTKAAALRERTTAAREQQEH